MNKLVFALPLVALLAACGQQSEPGGGAGGGDIKIVGSSTVYPFTKAVAEQFMRANAGLRVVVESTGTGAGMKLFCGGVGNQFPDIEDASRAIKKSEYDDCASKGVKNIIEVPVGIDGLTRTGRRPGETSTVAFRRLRSAFTARRRHRAPATRSASSS